MSQEQAVRLSRDILLDLGKIDSETRPISTARIGVGPFRDQVYSISWPGPINLEVDLNGVLVGYLDLGQASRKEKRIKIDFPEALERAQQISMRYKLMPSNTLPNRMFYVSSPTRRSFWSYEWDHVEPEVVPDRVRGEFCHIDLEVEAGMLLGFYKTKWSSIASFSPKIDRREALIAALEHLASLEWVGPPSDVEVRYEWIRPNRYWESEKMTFDENVRPCFAFKFVSLHGHWVEVWIDAQTRKVIGGDMLRSQAYPNFRLLSE